MVDLSLALYNFFLYVNKLDLFVTRVKRSLIHDVLNGSWSWFLNSVYKRSSGNIHKLNRLQTCLQHDKFIIQQVVHTFIYNDSEVYNWKLKKPHATKTRLRTLNLNCKLLRAKDSKPPVKITNLIAIWFGSRSWNTHWHKETNPRTLPESLTDVHGSLTHKSTSMVGPQKAAAWKSLLNLRGKDESSSAHMAYCRN